MNRSLLCLCLALMASMFAGCATERKTTTSSLTTGCNGLVNVRVSNIRQSPASIDVDPDPVCINFATGPAEIRWSFAQSGYQFGADAITFASGAPIYRGTVLQGGSAFQIVIDPNSVGSPWKYSIKFQSTSTPPLTWTCDPTIVNRESAVFANATFSCTALAVK